jgi:hypothetical protein
MSEPTQGDVKAAFDYREDNVGAVLIWRARPRDEFATENAWAVWNAKHAGTVAGWRAVNGYRYVRFAGKCRKVSRLVWLMHEGTVPDRIDHVSGDKADDRIGNLRDVTQAINSQNRARQRNNTSGTGGVHQSRSGRWVAQLNVGGKRKYLGSFADKSDAVLVREFAAAKAGFHQNHDRTGTRGGE